MLIAMRAAAERLMPHKELRTLNANRAPAFVHAIRSYNYTSTIACLNYCCRA